MKPSKSKILVWDAPVRVFHWLLVLSFFGAYLTAESERWRLLHVTLGYTLGGLIGFRVVWGLWGTRYARFRNFVRGPREVMRYGQSLLRGTPAHAVGHNPAGAVAIMLLLLLGVGVVASGWAIYNDMGGKLFEELHELIGNLMLLVVCVHVAGVVIASWLHRENLVRAMVTGKKEGLPDEDIRRAWWPVAMLILASIVLFWWFQYQSAP